MANVIDIKTRRPDSFKPSTLALAKQLVASEGVLEVVRLMEFIAYDFRNVTPVFERRPDEISEELRSDISDILRETAVSLCTKQSPEIHRPRRKEICR